MTFRLFDHDGDGVKTFQEVFTTVSQFTFLGLSVFMVVIEGLTPQDRFTNWEMGLIVCSSMGAVVLMEFIKSKNIVSEKSKKHSNSLYGNFTESEG